MHELTQPFTGKLLEHSTGKQSLVTVCSWESALSRVYFQHFFNIFSPLLVGLKFPSFSPRPTTTGEDLLNSLATVFTPITLSFDIRYALNLK